MITSTFINYIFTKQSILLLINLFSSKIRNRMNGLSTFISIFISFITFSWFCNFFSSYIRNLIDYRIIKFNSNNYNNKKFLFKLWPNFFISKFLYYISSLLYYISLFPNFFIIFLLYYIIFFYYMISIYYSNSINYIITSTSWSNYYIIIWPHSIV